MKLNSYKELLIWQKAIALVEKVYILTKKLPKTEDYALSSQMKRASIAIPSNIAEGFGRKNSKEFIQFLYISIASSFELETQLIICHKIYKLDITDMVNDNKEINKMTYGLINNLKLRVTKH